VVRLCLLGDLRVEVDGAVVDLASLSHKARLLLAMLALERRVHGRSQLAGRLWPDVREDSARVSLRTALSRLRTALGPAATRVLQSERDGGLALAPEVGTDIDDVERLLRDGDAEMAFERCSAELLPGLDDDWVLERRDELRERLAHGLRLAAAAGEVAGDLERAVALTRRMAALDPLAETPHRELIRRLAVAGDRGAALATYDRFRDRLAQELRVAPSVTTRSLVEQIRSERDEEPRVVPPARIASGGALPDLPAVLNSTEPAPLIGRQEALARLRDCWQRVSAGDAAMAVIAGEAGAGKTRLISAFAHETRERGAFVLGGPCHEEAAAPYGAFTEALRQHSAWFGAPSGWIAVELGRLLPDLAGPDRVEGDPQHARHRLFEAVASVLRDTAGVVPVLLVIEDIHWADHSTLLMLAHLTRTVRTAPLLVVGSLRVEEGRDRPTLEALLEELRRERRLDEVTLRGLSPHEVGELVSAHLGARASPDLAELLHRRTGGNPLFVEETVRHLREVHPAATAEQLVGAATSEIPRGVKAVIDRRLARLPSPVRAAVTAGGVAGEAFGLDDVVAASGFVDDDAVIALDGVLATGLVVDEARPGRYRFAHALVRETVLGTVTTTRRALMHRRLAEAIETLPPSRREPRLPDLARHLLDAHPLVEADRVAAVVVRAAEQATSQLGYENAAALLDGALAKLEAPDAERAALLLALGDARARMGRSDGARQCFDEAARLARRLDRADVLARAALGAAGLSVKIAPVRPEIKALLEQALASVDPSSPLRAALLARLAVELYYGPAPVRERLSEEALASGRRIGGRALLEALNARHVALWTPRHVEERLAIADELVDAARAAGDREAELQGLNWRVVDLLELADLPSAREAIDAHGRLADDLRLLAYAWYRPMWHAMLAFLAGRIEEASRLSDEGARIGRAANDENAQVLFDVQASSIRVAQGRPLTAPQRAALEAGARRPAGGAWRVWKAILAFDSGDTRGAARLLSDEATGLDALPFDANWLYTVTTLAVGAWLVHDPAAAASVYPRLLPYAQYVALAGRGTHCTGSVSLPLGLLATALGDDETAEQHLDAATRINDGLGARPFAAAARYALSTVLERRGAGERAAALQSQALSASRQLGMTLPRHIARYF
jgi:DNA-binding SARP family transcriptional activator/tetratricopeptide (TPR) repeat protein